MEHFVLYNIYVTIIWRYFYEKTLALIFVIFCFTACSCNDKTNTAAKDSNNSHIQTSEDSSYSDNSHIQTSEDSSYSSDTEDDSATEEAGVTIANIYGGYREGLMFVDKEKSGMSIHPIACIDKTGKTAFTVEASSVISGFCNGLALIRQEEKAVLCDKTGKIITAEDLGGNAFINESFIFELQK